MRASRRVAKTQHEASSFSRGRIERPWGVSLNLPLHRYRYVRDGRSRLVLAAPSCAIVTLTLKRNTGERMASLSCYVEHLGARISESKIVERRLSREIITHKYVTCIFMACDLILA